MLWFDGIRKCNFCIAFLIIASFTSENKINCCTKLYFSVFIYKLYIHIRVLQNANKVQIGIGPCDAIDHKKLWWTLIPILVLFSFNACKKEGANRLTLYIDFFHIHFFKNIFYKNVKDNSKIKFYF